MAHKNKTIADRQQYVVKANELIRKTRYNLTTTQQKIVLFAISKIKPNDLPNTQYEISIEELCRACGFAVDEGGYYYRAIKEDLKELTNRQWCVMPDKSEQTISWIGDAKIMPQNSTVMISFNPNMEPYLFALKEHYTQYHLEDVLVFKGKYSIRLYEILRSYTTQRAINEGREKEVSFTVEEIREMLDVKSYPRWPDFDRFVIKKAVEEINKYSDEIRISYDTFKKGRNITYINFIIRTPTTLEKMVAHQEKRNRL